MPSVTLSASVHQCITAQRRTARHIRHTPIGDLVRVDARRCFPREPAQSCKPPINMCRGSNTKSVHMHTARSLARSHAIDVHPVPVIVGGSGEAIPLVVLHAHQRSPRVSKHLEVLDKGLSVSGGPVIQPTSTSLHERDELRMVQGHLQRLEVSPSSVQFLCEKCPFTLARCSTPRPWRNERTTENLVKSFRRA